MLLYPMNPLSNRATGCVIGRILVYSVQWPISTPDSWLLVGITSSSSPIVESSSSRLQSPCGTISRFSKVLIVVSVDTDGTDTESTHFVNKSVITRM
ncbi:hypothetical protein AYI68_g3075 [Smittium mucronatum]|uniref:Uncharacterized protein n=1 Tax=Smittium mucronatum TaxID=133383 RepID=A0A1R0H0Y5_9FUNG|nr:hypothetical protein AYI68_g3075 [Smittium mucronatum]